ncbi:MAG TPA: hypothetical protein VGF90_06545 [Verrucomicrobiae bacterium]
MIKLCDINLAAKEKLPPTFAEKSGIGVHYMDAFIKPMNTKLPDGTRVGCKRKGLKVTLTVGIKKGDGLMRRLDVSKDPVVMLNAALQEAAKSAGVEIQITDKEIFVTPPVTAAPITA